MNLLWPCLQNASGASGLEVNGLTYINISPDGSRIAFAGLARSCRLTHIRQFKQADVLQIDPSSRRPLGRD